MKRQSPSIIPDRVRLAREGAGLSQPDVAARIGVSQQAIDKVERGVTKNPGFIVELAEAIGVSARYLRGLTDDPTPESPRQRIKDALDQMPDERLTELLQVLKPFLP